MFAVNCVSTKGSDDEDEDQEETFEEVEMENDVNPSPPTEDRVREINLGSEDDPRPTFVNENLNKEEISQYISLLKEYMDVFAWSYADFQSIKSKGDFRRIRKKALMKIQ